MKMRFPYFTPSGKMLIPVDCYTSLMHFVIPRATTRKLYEEIYPKTL